MDRASLLINLGALAFSLVALITSTAIALRQSKIMQHSNLLPILTELFDQFRSPDFKQHFRYVTTELREKYPPGEFDLDTLPEAADRHVAPVADFYQLVGMLVANNIIDGLLVASYMGRSTLRAWSKLDPYIQTTRKNRNDPNFFFFFEHLASLVAKYPPARINKLLKLSKVASPDTSSAAAEAPMQDKA
jgi:Domain of unknown function (DUF4760)